MLVANGIRKSTSKSYASSQNRFLSFCDSLRIKALPTSEKTILTFTAYLYKCGLTPSAVNGYLSAIRNLNIINGHSVPEFRSPRVKLALKAIMQQAKQPTKKLPLTFEKLCQLWPTICAAKYSIMWQALISLAFYAGLRCAEYTPSHDFSPGPFINQVTFSSDGKILNYKIYRTKTKLHGFSCQLACSKSNICARCTMVTYLGMRSRSNSVSSSSQLFVKGQQVVTSAQVNKFIKQTVAAHGWDSSCYSAHSLRAGAATTAARAGFKEWELKSLGGWSSSVYMSYIRDSNQHTASFPRRMARADSQ